MAKHIAEILKNDLGARAKAELGIKKFLK